MALLNDRTFKKKSPLKCNVGKLKMLQNIKTLANQNFPLNASFNQAEFEAEEKQKSER